MNALVQINEQIIEVILQGPPGPMGPPDNTLRTDLAANDGDTLIGTQSGASLRERIAALQAAIDAIDTSGGGGGDATIRTELLDTSGDTMIGTQDGSTLRVKLAGLASTASSLIASLAAKANDVVVTRTPLHYGCVGDGVTNDYANMLTALQSGFAIDGLGKTYAIGSQLAPTSFKGLRNATLKWNSTANMQVQGRALLYIQNLDGWEVDNVKFDMGTVENIGATGSPDNIRAGFRTTSTGYSDNCRVTNCEAYGAGAGTGIELRNLNDSYVAGNYVHDRIVSDVGITNDCQNGIHIHDVINSTVKANRVSRLYLRVGAALNKKWSRGILTSSCIDIVYNGNKVSFVDQGHDFSGASPGNKGIAVSGCQASDVFTYGFKFANVARDFTISGNIVRRFGYGAFVWSGNAGEGANQTQNHLCVGNYAHEFTGEFNGTGHGFWVQSGTGYPRGIRIENCGVSTASGGGLINGFSNSASLGDALYPNSVEDCRSVGQSGNAIAGFHRRFCAIRGTGNQSIANAASLVLITWDTEVEDSMGMHSTSSNTSRIVVPEGGWYRAKGVLQFAANAAGNRTAGVLKNGSLAAASTIMLAINGTVTNVAFDIEVLCTAGQYLEVFAEQNSGGAVNIDRGNSSFSVEYLRAA